MEKFNLEKVMEAELEGNCITLWDENKNKTSVCYPIISEGIFKGGTTSILELHRRPGMQEVIIEFDKPVGCAIEDGTLKCPRETKKLEKVV
jgi:hypothetical protein